MEKGQVGESAVIGPLKSMTQGIENVLVVPPYYGYIFMAKWQKPKDSKALAERKIYSQIKRAEKIPASKELSEDQEHMKYCFAMHCHKLRYEKAPSGLLWPEVFQKKWGMNLSEYGEVLRQRQQEKREARSTPEDESLP